MDGGGNVLERTKYTNKRAAADVFAKYAAAKYDCTAVFESTGNYGFKTQLALEEYGIPYKIANPLRLKLSQSGLKTDKLDAERLANRLRMDDIPESYAYPPEDRRVLDILHDRINQVKARVMVLNRQHSILAKYDYEISASGSTDSASDKCQEFLDNLKLDGGRHAPYGDARPGRQAHQRADPDTGGDGLKGDAPERGRQAHNEPDGVRRVQAPCWWPSQSAAWSGSRTTSSWYRSWACAHASTSPATAKNTAA